MRVKGLSPSSVLERIWLNTPFNPVLWLQNEFLGLQRQFGRSISTSSARLADASSPSATAQVHRAHQ